MEPYTSGRLEFSMDEASGKWWAIDDHNVEYCLSKPIMPWHGAKSWCATAQKRTAFDKVTTALGTYPSFEEAARACEDYDPVADGIA